MSSRFIVLEGGDAAGKSTQCRVLAERLDAVATREPGATRLGAAVRSLVLDPATGAVDPRAEALLMAADRAQHVAEVIRPALAAGRHVVSDRYLHSSVAYQGYGRGLAPAEVAELSHWATDGLLPDVVVFLDLPVSVARARLAGVAPDRMEAEDDGFHDRVRAGFVAQAEAAPERWAVLDAAGSPEDVAGRIWAAVVERCPELAAT